MALNCFSTLTETADTDCREQGTNAVKVYNPTPQLSSKVNGRVDIGTLLNTAATAGRGWELLVEGMEDDREEIREEWDRGEVDEEYKLDAEDGRIKTAKEFKDRDEGRREEEMEGRQNKDSTDTPGEANTIDDTGEESSDCKREEKAGETQDVSRQEERIEEGSEKVNEHDKAEDGDDETKVCRWRR